MSSKQQNVLSSCPKLLDHYIGVATEALHDVKQLDTFPYYTWHHAVIVPVGHPLEHVQPLTLQALAEYPIVTYHEGLTGRAKIDRAFAAADVVPDISMSALDSDVIKTYVELGLGIGIVASMSFNAAKDTELHLLQCDHLFEANTTYIALRRGHYLRSYAYRFIELCSPKLDEATIRMGLTEQS